LPEGIEKARGGHEILAPFMICIITAPASSGQQAFSTQAFTAFVTTLLAHLQALIWGFTRYLPLIVPYGYCSSSS